jgi:hypothetical protein
MKRKRRLRAIGDAITNAVDGGIAANRGKGFPVDLILVGR